MDRPEHSDSVYALRRELIGKRAFRALVTAVVALFVTVGVLGIAAKRTADSNKHALCTFVDDLQRRVNQTREFLADHPEGFAGIPAATLVNQAENQQRTIDALDNLNC